MMFSEKEINLACKAIKEKTDHAPGIAVVLGSGLGSISEKVNKPDVIKYEEIPHWPSSTVEGHSGNLVIGNYQGIDVLFMQGRVHYYEGYPIQWIGFPIRVMQSLGIKTIIMTNAVGAVNQSLEAGDLMIITDHIAFMPMAGQNPLIGPNLSDFGPRFPDVSQCYDRELIKITESVAAECKIPIQKGVYFCLSGPCYETPAELRMINRLGGDVVGMSTVPEVIVARHGNTRVLGISIITNKAKLDGTSITSHEEVIENSGKASKSLEMLLSNLLKKIST